MTSSAVSTDAESTASGISASQRYLTLATVVLGSSLYGTALLTASTLLPQMQGAMAATQDEIAWAMTFNILATAVVTPMTGWLVARFGGANRDGGVDRCFSVATLLCGDAHSLQALVFWRIVQGGAGAPVVPLSRSIVLDSFPRRQDRPGQLDLRHGGGVGPVIGPTLGGYLAEELQLALGVLHAGAGRAGIRCRLRLTLPRRPAGGAGPARLDRLPDARRGDAVRAARAVARPAARLVRIGRDRARDVGAARAFYMFLAHSLTAQRAVPEPAAAAGPQLRDRAGAGDDLRHAELHARWCCCRRCCSSTPAIPTSIIGADHRHAAASA